MLLQDTNLSMQGLQSPVSGSFKTCLLPTVKIWFAIGGGRSIRYGIKKIWTVRCLLKMMQSRPHQGSELSWKFIWNSHVADFIITANRCQCSKDGMATWKRFGSKIYRGKKNNRKMQERHFAPTESTTRAKKIYKRIQGVQWSKFLFVRMFLKNTCG